MGNITHQEKLNTAQASRQCEACGESPAHAVDCVNCGGPVWFCDSCNYGGMVPVCNCQGEELGDYGEYEEYLA